jgi:hypothetical protein
LTGAWAPRLGATVDPFGKGRTKLYYNFSRFFEYIPLDLAERSLSAETDFRNGRFAPDFEMVAPESADFFGQTYFIGNKSGAGDRAEFVDGNFFESFPAGAAAYIIKSVF